MPQDERSSKDNISDPASQLFPSKQGQQNSSGWLRTPAPVKRVFDKFPLVTYDANDLPKGRVSSREKHALHLFTTEEGARNGRPSFNPGCLKWQSYLLFQGVDFVATPSSNHASPTGVLPFLLPATPPSANVSPVPSNRLQRWATATRRSGQENVEGSNNDPRERKEHEDSPRGHEESKESTATSDMRYEAYISLLDHRIRDAYLYALYLCPSNFASIVQPLYIDSSTSNYLVRLALSYQLRNAAQAELLKQSSTIDAEALYRESEKAFSALSEVLGDDTYFFGERHPGLFDAAVFAYTNILLDETMQWRERRISDDLSRRENLIRHRKRIAERYFPST